MKALILKRYGRTDGIEFAELAKPLLKADEMLVRVHAAGLNPVDNMIATGQFKPMIKLPLPATMGSDLAGVVVEVGRSVTSFKIGDAVFASTFDRGFGAFAELVAVPEAVAAHKPAKLSFVEAASLPMVALTSWQALVTHARVQRGQKVFIPAGAGGIGSFAIQLAKHLGAVVATTTSTGNVEFVRRLGADKVIDYKQQDFAAVLRDYDVVLGTLPGENLEHSMQIVTAGSRVVSLVGPPDSSFARERGMNMLMQWIFGLLSFKITRLARRQGASYAFMFVRADGDQLRKIAALVEAVQLRPVIDKVFPFDQAREGLAYLETGRAKGKVVLQMVA